MGGGDVHALDEDGVVAMDAVLVDAVAGAVVEIADGGDIRAGGEAADGLPGDMACGVQGLIACHADDGGVWLWDNDGVHDIGEDHSLTKVHIVHLDEECLTFNQFDGVKDMAGYEGCGPLAIDGNHLVCQLLSLTYARAYICIKVELEIIVGDDGEGIELLGDEIGMDAVGDSSYHRAVDEGRVAVGLGRVCLKHEADVHTVGDAYLLGNIEREAVETWGHGNGYHRVGIGGGGGLGVIVRAAC